MLNRDRVIVSAMLHEMGLKVLSLYARQDKSEELLKGYIAIIVRECIKRKDFEMQRKLINLGVISMPEFFKIGSQLIRRS